uniref:DNA-directed RNA polymerase III subunit RPC8 isoform X2 n=1 Tax=Urocitellus parryii TaxID=9999 RepID=UPI000E559998|nr:DNA-directed RNA polymerase III subunit RPC8 isoform X2 [Urocitellus parryii]
MIELALEAGSVWSPWGLFFPEPCVLLSFPTMITSCRAPTHFHLKEDTQLACGYEGLQRYSWGTGLHSHVYVYTCTQVVYNVGLCICLFDITKLEDAYVFPGDGASHTKVSLGFFDDILIPPESLQQPAKFDEAEQVWVWEYETEEGAHDLYMDTGEEIRFRVVDESFVDTSPTGPSSAETTSSSEELPKKEAPYTLVVRGFDGAAGITGRQESPVCSDGRLPGSSAIGPALQQVRDQAPLVWSWPATSPQNRNPCFSRLGQRSQSCQEYWRGWAGLVPCLQGSMLHKPPGLQGRNKPRREEWPGGCSLCTYLEARPHELSAFLAGLDYRWLRRVGLGVRTGA